MGLNAKTTHQSPAKQFYTRETATVHAERKNEMSFSQNDEEQIIAHALEGLSAGRLLDIGAYCPDVFSNTRALIDHGWHAVLVEPSPAPFQALLKHYADNHKVELVNAAISIAGGLSDFYDSGGDAVSSLVTQHKDRWEAGSGVRFRRYTLVTMRIDELFERFGYDYDFISLDVESMNLELFRAIPFEQMPKLKVLCVEHDGYLTEMANRMATFGFAVIVQNGENVIFKR